MSQGPGPVRPRFNRKSMEVPNGSGPLFGIRPENGVRESGKDKRVAVDGATAKEMR